MFIRNEVAVKERPIRLNMSKDKKYLTLFVTFCVDLAKVEAWKEAQRPVWAACAQEPQCLLFDVFEDHSTGRMRLVEVWSEDREWFETVRK
jgi:quinol monooxygenase YgiN